MIAFDSIASGSTAFRLAALEVATGVRDVALAVGVDKPSARPLAGSQTGTRGIEGGRIVPFTHFALLFALLAQRYMERHDATPEDFARVAVKNHGNGEAPALLHSGTFDIGVGAVCVVHVRGAP